MVMSLPASFIPDKDSTATPKRSNRAKRASSEALSTKSVLEEEEGETPAIKAGEEGETTPLPPSPPPPTASSKEEVVLVETTTPPEVGEEDELKSEDDAKQSEVVPIRHIEEETTIPTTPSTPPPTTVEVLVSTKTLRELKDMCLALGLSDKGKKADLAQRWMDAK